MTITYYNHVFWIPYSHPIVQPLLTVGYFMLLILDHSGSVEGGTHRAPWSLCGAWCMCHAACSAQVFSWHKVGGWRLSQFHLWIGQKGARDGSCNPMVLVILPASTGIEMALGAHHWRNTLKESKATLVNKENCIYVQACAHYLQDKKYI